jgi:arabinofuranosyltransferase
MSEPLRGERWLRLGFAAALVLLVGHALFYRFLCDDAFISFRYAHNLATGQGLVFNPGFERVEGYSNFLWVVVLAALDAAGAKPEHVAPVLSILLTIVLWALVARASMRWIPSGPWRFVILLPCAWMALTRSVAVWSTSGLETRLFEVLVIAGVFRLIDDVAEVPERPARKLPWGAFFLALAALTRPDGMLVGGCAMGAAAAWLAMRRRLRIADVAAHALVFGGIVGAHLVFRHVYYGDWVPNTYYAKVGGRSWWDMGAAYLACFAIEYAAWLWVPLLFTGVRGFVKDSRAEIPLLAAAVVLPHVLYVASIGGDHFEFRPLDLYFPFVFVLMARGAAALHAGVLGRVGVALYAVAVTLGLVAIPWQSHRQFTSEYNVGFPGLGATRGERVSFLDPSRDPVYRWPGLRRLASAHRSLLRGMTSRLVGVRQEEHALFLGSVVPEGRRLRALVAAGVLPQDTHVAMSAVGAIPYYSGLRVLDRLGLTDRIVAKLAPGELRIMAHDRHATLDYAAASGVDFWTEHPVHLLTRVDDDNLVWRLTEARATGEPVYFADLGNGDVLVARLPQGIDKTAPRFPKLALKAAADDAGYAALLDAVIDAHRREVASHPSAREARVSLGSALSARGRDDEALPIFRALADENDPDGWYNLGTILARREEFDAAADAFRRALAVDPSLGPARHNLGLALARAGRLKEAIAELREAARLEPDSEGALYTLGVALLTAGDGAGAGECMHALERLGTVQGDALARRLAEHGAGQRPK